MKRIHLTLSLVFLLCAGSIPGCAKAPEPASVVPEGQIYRWTDSAGKAHFTPSLEQLPPTIREQITALLSAPSESRRDLSEEGRWASLNIDKDVSEVPFGYPADSRGSEADQPQEPYDPQRAERNAEVNARIVELEDRIALHEAKLKVMISTPDAGSNTDFVDQADFRTIAQELPALQAELKELKAEQAQH